MSHSTETSLEFRCPGQTQAISRAVHRARLAGAYGKCRECPHRTDTGGFSARQAKRIAEGLGPGPSPALPDEDGITGVVLNEITPAVVRRAATAFGLLLREQPNRDREGAVHPQPSHDREGAVHPQPSRDREGAVHPQPSRDREGAVHPQPNRDREGAAQGPAIAPTTTPVTSPLPHGRGSDSKDSDPKGCSVSEGSSVLGSWPTVVLAGDGRRTTAPLVAAAAEGLRFAGCRVIDVGPATKGLVALALHESRADGGMLVGNPGQRLHQAGLRFWVGERPMARGGPENAPGGVENLGHRCAMAQAPDTIGATPNPVAQASNSVAQAAMLQRFDALLGSHLDRPTREFGSLERTSFEADYLASLAPWYHGVRPLMVVLETPSRPLVEYVRKLSASLECRFLDDPTTPAESQIVEHNAHFGMRIDGNGEAACVFDERGRFVPAERLLRLIAGRLIAERAEGTEHAAAAPTVVVEEDLGAPTERSLQKMGCRVVRAASGRASMHRAMEQDGAMLGGGASGRFWYGRPGHVAADALVTLSLMLAILSQSDRPLSRVLDAVAPGE